MHAVQSAATGVGDGVLSYVGDGGGGTGLSSKRRGVGEGVAVVQPAQSA